jgi:hypothetical protein
VSIVAQQSGCGTATNFSFTGVGRSCNVAPRRLESRPNYADEGTIRAVPQQIWE